MPTLDELGQKVKAKYPGAYDSLDNETLALKVQAKFPGAYDQFKATTPPGEVSPDEPPEDAKPALGDEPSAFENLLAKAGTTASNWKELGSDIYGNVDQPLAAVRGALPDQVDTGAAGEVAYNAAKTFLPEQGARALVGGVEQTPAIAKGMLTPENVAWAGASALPGAQPLVAGHFARLGSEEALAAVPQYQAATTDPARAEAVSRGLGGAAMVLGPALHAGREFLPERVAPSPEPTTPRKRSLTCRCRRERN